MPEYPRVISCKPSLNVGSSSSSTGSRADTPLTRAPLLETPFRLRASGFGMHHSTVHAPTGIRLLGHAETFVRTILGGPVHPRQVDLEQEDIRRLSPSGGRLGGAVAGLTERTGMACRPDRHPGPGPEFVNPILTTRALAAQPTSRSACSRCFSSARSTGD
jgi:hypothetical protein